MASSRKLSTLDSLSPRNIARSHQAGIIERTKSRRRLDRISKKKQAKTQIQEELKMQTQTAPNTATKKKRTRPGIVIPTDIRTAILEHIDRVGVADVAQDIENLEPTRSGSSSARDSIRELRKDAGHRWLERSIKMWTRLLLCWSSGKRPHELRRERIDLVMNGKVVDTLGETAAREPEAVDGWTPSQLELGRELGLEPVPESEWPENLKPKALMSYQVNADGLPVMTMDGVVIRVAGTPERPLFRASDVCDAMGISNVTEALRGLSGDEISSPEVIDSIGRKQEVKHVTEPGLYKLIQKSRKPQAKEFDRWVRHEVLPSIRRTGAYATEASQLSGSVDRRMMAEFASELLTQLIPALRQVSAPSSAPAQQTQVFDSDGFEVPSGELPKTNKRAGVNGLIEQYHRDHPEVTRETCHSMLHCRFKSAYNISPPKDHPKKIAWYEENGHIDALYALAYAMFSKRKAD